MAQLALRWGARLDPSYKNRPLKQALQKTPSPSKQLWKLSLPRRSVIWVVCLALISCSGLVSLNIANGPSMDPRAVVDQRTQKSLLGHRNSTQEAEPSPRAQARPASDVKKLIDFSVGGCNIWRGDWIWHPAGPAYTNATCPYIQPHQNCMKNGRPDHGFLHWRWKPHHCDLPLFDAETFLKLVSGKKWAFIGDSLARNNYQSVICYLSQVETPVSIYNDGYDGNLRWYFKSYNFTLAVVWSPFLIKGTEEAADGFPKGSAKLHLDVVDEAWASSFREYDYIVLSTGHWFLRSSVYFHKRKLLGCFYCSKLNLTDVGFTSAYRVALRTAFDHLIASKYEGVVFFRTYSPEHWENAPWDQGGNCNHKAPVKGKYTALQAVPLDMYKIQLEEFAKTMQRRSEFSFNLKIVDITQAALLRPDAHPGPYGHDFHYKMQHDCVHWCLPGAVDAWSAMLLEVLRHL